MLELYRSLPGLERTEVMSADLPALDDFQILLQLVVRKGVGIKVAHRYLLSSGRRRRPVEAPGMDVPQHFPSVLKWIKVQIEYCFTFFSDECASHKSYL